MFKEDKVVITDQHEVACEGESPAVGHPKVYLNFGTKKEIICPYCSMKFILKDK